MSSMFDQLGSALRWMRSHKSRRQAELATAAGVTKGMLSAYETGKQKPSLDTLSRLLTALGADLTELQQALALVREGRIGVGVEPLRSPTSLPLPQRDDPSLP